MEKIVILSMVLLILVPRCTASKELNELQEPEIKTWSFKDAIIASLRADIEDKVMPLQMQNIKTNTANQQIEQIEKKDLEIKTLSNNCAIAEIEDQIKNELEKMTLHSSNKNNQSSLGITTPHIISVCPKYMIKQYKENKKLKSDVQELRNQIKQMENKQNECELKITNLVKLNDDMGNQEATCQKDLESQKTDSIKKDMTIEELKKVEESNRNLLESQWNETNYMNARIKEMEIVAEYNKIQLNQCQENHMNSQKTKEDKKSVEEKLNECQLNNTNLVKLKDENFKEYQSKQQIILESCQNNLESQRNESTYKDVTIKELKEIANSNNDLWTKCQKSSEEIQTELGECQSNNTNLVKLKDENFKEYQSNQQIILETCQNNLESLKNESTYKDVTIKELKEVADSNNDLWTKCQKSSEEIQTELDSYKTKYANINNLIESCEKHLESQRIETTDKNATINELNKVLDECKKNNAELNNRLSSKEECRKRCKGKGSLKDSWCKLKCKWNC